MTTPYGPADLVQEIQGHLAHRTELAALEVAAFDLAPNLRPPSIVIGLPSWTLTATAAGDGGQSLYRLTVYVVVADTIEAFGQVLQHVQRVARALDAAGGIRLTEIRPTTFPVGSVELPAYGIDIEVTA